MTNLLALITFELVTNWTTVSFTVPQFNATATYQPNAVITYQATMANQRGVIESNTVALIRWEGRTNKCVLKSVVIGNLERSIDAKEVR